MTKKPFYEELMSRVYPWTETRPMIKRLPDDKPLFGAEIGVRFGYNALNILKKKNIGRLYLIDPYIKYNTVAGRTFNEPDEMAEKRARLMLDNYKRQTKFIIKRSEDAVDDLPDDLDFVYIDGLHTYEAVKKDIELYYPKVKKGGYIGGDDFSIKFVGLCKAVIEYAEENDLQLKGQFKDWWFKK